MDEIKIKVSGVTKSFGEGENALQVIGHADFIVKKGEFLVILGPSGCGKSTLLRIVAGLETPTTGEVFTDSLSVRGPDSTRGMVFQKYTSFPWLTVQRNVEFGLRLNSNDRDKVRSTASEYIRAVGLEQFADRYPSTLSGGQQQRVALARTLANRPTLLLMDEPFGALDAQTRREMQELLLDVWQKDGTTVVFVTHDVEETLLLGDRVYVSTPRPSSLHKEIIVPFDRPRKPSLRETEAFRQLEAEVRALLHTDLENSSAKQDRPQQTRQAW